MTFSQVQKDLLFGTLLGDGNLQTFSNGRTWRYRSLQKAAHKEYLFHKYEILKNLCGEKTEPIFDKIEDERTGTISKRWYFNTTTHNSLRFYANMFYTYDKVQGKWIKDVPSQENLEKNLTPRALAFFYMDNGALKWKGKSNAMRICTESFSGEGVKRLQNVLLKLYQLDTSTTNKKVKFDVDPRKRLAIPEGSSSEFREIIKPYLVDCMKYKVSDGNCGSLK